MPVTHCGQLQADRALGEFWERQFCLLASRYGFTFSPLQIGRRESALAYRKRENGWENLKLPDVVIWSAKGQCHEIKHKSPNKHGCFGLEGYRFHSLLDFAHETHMGVMYTIHDHSRTAGRDDRINRIEDWVTASILDLGQRAYRTGYNRGSYVSGEAVQRIAIYYWPISNFTPLSEYWEALRDHREPEHR